MTGARVYQNGLGSTGAADLNAFLQSTTLATDLLNTPGISGMNVWVTGTFFALDGGQGFYTWAPGATGPTALPRVIAPSGGAAGAWVQVPPSSSSGGAFITPESFGADPTGQKNSTIAFNAAISTGLTIIGTPGATYAVSNLVITSSIIDLNGSTLVPFAGADWCVKITGQAGTIRNGLVNDQTLITLYSTTTTGIVASGSVGTPQVIPVASAAKITVGKLIAVTQTDGSHWVAKVSAVSGLNVTVLDGLSVGCASGAIVETAHGLIMSDNGLDGRIENIIMPVCPFGIELIATQTPPFTHEMSISHIRFDNFYLCGMFRDVDVDNSEIFDVIGFGTANGNAGYRGYVGEGRNPGIYPTGGNTHTDVNMLGAETGFQLRGIQLDEFHNCLADTYGNTVSGGLGWDIGAGCAKLRFSNMYGSFTNGQSAPGIGVKISGACLGIFISGLYTRFNDTADLSIDNASTVYLDPSTWGESRVFIGGGTINQALPLPLGGAPGNETIRVKNAGVNQVNRFEVQGNITGNGVILNANGTDTNIQMFVISKGSGPITLQNNFAGTPATVFSASGPTNAANYVQALATPSGAPQITTNAGNLGLNSATGLVLFANANSSSANASVATALGSVGPVGSHTAPQEWLTVVMPSGATRYIPCF